MAIKRRAVVTAGVISTGDAASRRIDIMARLPKIFDELIDMILSREKGRLSLGFICPLDT